MWFSLAPFISIYSSLGVEREIYFKRLNEDDVSLEPLLFIPLRMGVTTRKWEFMSCEMGGKVFLLAASFGQMRSIGGGGGAFVRFPNIWLGRPSLFVEYEYAKKWIDPLKELQGVSSLKIGANFSFSIE